jgi:hypothetical protein
MSGVLDLELGAEALERSKVDLAVAGFFSDEFPLRGGAGRVDWRLCGLVSDQILDGRIQGGRDEALLVPSAGQLRANRVMVVGLGSRSEYRLKQIGASVQQAVLRALALASPSLAMSPLGLAGDEFPRCAEAIVAGAAAGFGDSPASIRLRLVVPRAEINLAAQAIEAAMGAQKTFTVRFRPPTSPSNATGAPTSTHSAHPQSRADSHRSPR